ncbi:class I SAM-dependent methyltransferase [Leptolinea tardivitalis]|uniref:class I SAM-dependent methyltransferase n=1 Tax=Leptolinea tardivitalis TaxID=229920 RepID=UPI0007817A7B|nr:class I SAM-dependent methyltransferase [Leptolinea tardivitalis]GAP21357.1 methylase [Leptolinea tardivitalis]
MTIDQAFNASTPTYDDWMQRALLGYTDLFGTAVRVIPFGKEQPIRVLDLGAGTGSFAAHVYALYPNAQFVLMDVADKMLDAARDRFKDQGGRFQFEIADYRYLQGEEQYDLVVSSLSIHHLTDEEKSHLFQSIYGILKPAGAFINIDQIRGETPALRQLYWNRWLSHVHSSGATEEQINASIERRTRYDQDALLSDQLTWLRQAGFDCADIVYKNFFLGVFLAIKGDVSKFTSTSELFVPVSRKE